MLKFAWEDTIKARFRQILHVNVQQSQKLANSSNPADMKLHCPKDFDTDVWPRLVDKYYSDSTRLLKSEQNKKNRMTEKGGSIAKHIGGSAPFCRLKRKMELKMQRPVTNAELYLRTHRKDGNFIDDRSREVYNTYETLVHEKYGQEASVESIWDAGCWTQAAGEPIKGCVYGLGAGAMDELFSTGGGSSSQSVHNTPGPSVTDMQTRLEQTEEKLEAANKEIQELKDLKGSIPTLITSAVREALIGLGLGSHIAMPPVPPRDPADNS